MLFLEKLNLRLFDGDGGGTAGPAGAEGAQSESGGNELAGKAQKNAVAARKSNPLASMKYGIQPQEEAPAEEEIEETPISEEAPKEESFEDLIKGKYKKDFDGRVQQILNQRFKDHKTLQENAEKIAPLMDFLAERFGKDSKDFEGIQKALMDEDGLFESIALKEGKSTEEIKQRFKDESERSRIHRENETLRQQLQFRERQEQDLEAARAFREEAEKVKQKYDHFDLSKEMQNPKFVELLNRKIGMQAAFELCHFDELMSGSMYYTAQKVREQVVNNVKSRAARPAENGTAARATAQVKSDVSKLTKADRAEISRRVARGEKISFG